LHFVSDDRTIGGHVLDSRIKEGLVRYDVCRDWLVKLDGSAGFDGAELHQDLGHELRRVEGSRGAIDQGR
jgi:acetolactate decarboxylase